MTRTKRLVISPDIRQIIEDKRRFIKEQYDSEVDNLNEYLQNLLHNIETHKNTELTQFPPEFLNKTLAELKDEGNYSVFENTSILHTLSTKKKLNNTGIFNEPRTKISDEAASTRSQSSDRKRGRSPTKASAMKSRVSRSLSRSAIRKNVTIQVPTDNSEEDEENVTPKRMPPPNSYYITPKVKPNIPLTILRRPKAGEMALSMQGSPLMVNGIITEECANVNIPLEDGKVLSLQPCKQIRWSQVPEIPEITRKQLLKLRDHLNIVCQDKK